MKKLLSIALLMMSTVSFADNVMTVNPIKSTVNDPVDDTDNTLTFCIPDNFGDYQGLQFDLYVPEGIEIDETYIIKGKGLPYTERRGEITYKHTLEGSEKPSDMDGFKKYTFLVYNTSDSYFTGSEIFSIYCGTTSTVKEGIYPIYIKDVNEAKTDVESTKFDFVTTYVVVGNPTGAELALQGTISEGLNEALANETAIGTLDLTKVTASSGTFTYKDGRAVKAPADLKGKVAYKREVSGLASVCLPFAADLKAYTYSSMAGEYAIFDEVSALEANTPAIVDANIDITVEEATIGSVEAQTITKGYYLKGGKFYSVNGSAVVAPLRGYWELGAGVKGFKFNDADAIMTVDANANEDIFNLNGVKLNKAQRGVNIIGGKKVMK